MPLQLGRLTRVRRRCLLLVSAVRVVALCATRRIADKIRIATLVVGPVLHCLAVIDRLAHSLALATPFRLELGLPAPFFHQLRIGVAEQALPECRFVDLRARLGRTCPHVPALLVVFVAASHLKVRNLERGQVVLLLLVLLRSDHLRAVQKALERRVIPHDALGRSLSGRVAIHVIIGEKVLSPVAEDVVQLCLVQLRCVHARPRLHPL